MMIGQTGHTAAKGRPLRVSCASQWLRCKRYSRGQLGIAHGMGKDNALRLLGLPRRPTKAQIKNAYLALIKQAHPDISLDEDATQKAVALNEAYEILIQESESARAKKSPGPFDSSAGDANYVFVNPFMCNINPLDWEQLQKIASKGDRPEKALEQVGVYAPDSAIYYVTNEQLVGLYDLLSEMDESFAFSTTAWMLTEHLARIRTANYRWGGQSAKE